MLQEQAGQEADIIWGNGYDESLGENVCVTILATGFATDPNKLLQEEKPREKFHLADKESEINYLDDEQPEEEFMDSGEMVEQEEGNEVLHMEVVKPVTKRKKKKRKKPVVQEGAKDVPIDNDSWFNRQFSRFFDGEDQSLDNS